MASPVDPTHLPDHIAVFPPANNQACKLDIWSQAPIKTQTPTGIVETHVDRPAGFEEQEAERWDGMS